MKRKNLLAIAATIANGSHTFARTAAPKEQVQVPAIAAIIANCSHTILNRSKEPHSQY
jgi:hypothetical protein